MEFKVHKIAMRKVIHNVSRYIDIDTSPRANELYTPLVVFIAGAPGR